MGRTLGPQEIIYGCQKILEITMIHHLYFLYLTPLSSRVLISHHLYQLHTTHQMHSRC
jgi:hypothetical protein